MSPFPSRLGGSARFALAVGLVAALGSAGGAGAQGGASGPELQVNSYTTSSQARPRVARNDAGDFVVVWESLGSSGTDVEGLSVQGRRFSAAGEP
ncbi:MAG: repeat-containing protein, partial [Acidobacteria bacterium]|nr:repeat-containing protein [Acidobacteriota bacterium]